MDFVYLPTYPSFAASIDMLSLSVLSLFLHWF